MLRVRVSICNNPVVCLQSTVMIVEELCSYPFAARRNANRLAKPKIFLGSTDLAVAEELRAMLFIFHCRTKDVRTWKMSQYVIENSKIEPQK